MHNIWVRLNAVIFFSLTVLLVLATLCSFRYMINWSTTNFRIFTRPFIQHFSPPRWASGESPEVEQPQVLVSRYCSIAVPARPFFHSLFRFLSGGSMVAKIVRCWASIWKQVRRLQIVMLEVSHIFPYASLDLRPAFHWNLKQLFVFVLAEYETKANVRTKAERLASNWPY